MVFDGIVQKENAFGVDLEKGFIEAGFELFKDQSSFEKQFLVANLLKEEELKIVSNYSKAFDLIYCVRLFFKTNKILNIKFFL